MGPLGGKQGFLPYPSGPSRHSIAYSLGHLVNYHVLLSFRYIMPTYQPILPVCMRCVEKINNLSFFLFFLGTSLIPFISLQGF